MPKKSPSPSKPPRPRSAQEDFDDLHGLIGRVLFRALADANATPATLAHFSGVSHDAANGWLDKGNGSPHRKISLAHALTIIRRDRGPLRDTLAAFLRSEMDASAS